MIHRFSIILIAAALVVFVVTCSSEKNEQKAEQIPVSSAPADTVLSDSAGYSINPNASLGQLATIPESVVLTGLPQYRLVTVYRQSEPRKRKSEYSSGYYYENDESGSERYQHFMPGIDLIYGYNLLNVAHCDFSTERTSFLFDHPVLIKSLYYPSFVQDSVEKKPISRNYYLVSVYDQDTNQDSLINKRDLRRFYHFNAEANIKTPVIPPDYSVVRSQYDSKNDFMYLFARHDADKNGLVDKKEPMHVFWLDLKRPGTAKRLY